MPDFSRYLVTGGRGLIAKEMTFGIKSNRSELDVTDERQVREFCAKMEPSGIVCLSSYDLRTSEAQPFNANRTNILGVCNMAKEAARRNIPIVIISSGAVFNGPLGATFDEDSPPDPQQTYGLSKYLAEQFVTSIAAKHLIVRTGWVYGGIGAHHVNFIDSCIDKARKGETITASNNQQGCPTYLKDFIEHFEAAIRAEEEGIIHLANQGTATALDVARFVVETLSSQSKVEVMSQANLSTVKRSASEVLVSRHPRMRAWREALADYIKLA